MLNMLPVFVCVPGNDRDLVPGLYVFFSNIIDIYINKLLVLYRQIYLSSVYYMKYELRNSYKLRSCT